jgi:transcriptional regulator LmrA/YxaF-like protein
MDQKRGREAERRHDPDELAAMLVGLGHHRVREHREDRPRRERQDEATTFADAIDAIFAPWRHALVESSFTMGCPIAATVVDASADDRLRAEARTLFDRWRDAVRTALVQFGARESTAQDDASVLLAALEGALILSRAHQSTQPLDTVQRFFTTSLTQAAPDRAATAP